MRYQFGNWILLYVSMFCIFDVSMTQPTQFNQRNTWNIGSMTTLTSNIRVQPFIIWGGGMWCKEKIVWRVPPSKKKSSKGSPKKIIKFGQFNPKTNFFLCFPCWTMLSKKVSSVNFVQKLKTSFGGSRGKKFSSTKIRTTPPDD